MELIWGIDPNLWNQAWRKVITLAVVCLVMLEDYFIEVKVDLGISKSKN